MSDLILVPTTTELDIVRPRLNAQSCSFQLCGFGPIAAAARTSSLIARYRPRRVILLGIAGTFDADRYPAGTAIRFDEVRCDGVGVGSGPGFLTASELGWPQFSDRDDRPRIGDTITLDSAYISGVPSAGTLLTCCSGSRDPDEARARLARYPGVVAEDMEGFAVALACQLARVPLQIVRGISNVVGDRDHRNWKVDKALGSAAKLATRMLPRDWIPAPV